MSDNFLSNISSLFSCMDNPVMRAGFPCYLILSKDGGVWAHVDMRPKQTVEKWIPKQHENFTGIIVDIESERTDRTLV